MEVAVGSSRCFDSMLEAVGSMLEAVGSMLEAVDSMLEAVGSMLEAVVVEVSAAAGYKRNWKDKADKATRCMGCRGTGIRLVVLGSVVLVVLGSAELESAVWHPHHRRS